MGRLKRITQNTITAFLCTIILSVVFSCKTQYNNNEVTVLYKNDKDGNTLLGSKNNIVNAIRKGADIKIGWQSVGKEKKIEHLSNAIWLAVLNEKEVVAYLDPQVFASIDWESLAASYNHNEDLDIEWRVVLTTSGNFDAVWYNRKTGSVIRRIPQKHEMTWFARF